MSLQKGQTFLGYHGTSNQNAGQIIRQKRFVPSLGDKEWLGDGVYFFEGPEAYVQAVWWAKQVKRSSRWAVLRVEASLLQAELLDLDNPRDRRIIEGAVEYYEERCLKEGRKIVGPYDGAIINMYCLANDNIKAVRATYSFQTKYTRAGKLRIRPLQTQLCIRDTSCIKYDTLAVAALGAVPVEEDQNGWS